MKSNQRVIRTTLTDHQRIIFNGNGYSSEWINEANKRGLPNAKSFVDAIPALTDQNTIDLYEKHHVLTKKNYHLELMLIMNSILKQLILRL